MSYLALLIENPAISSVRNTKGPPGVYVELIRDKDNPKIVRKFVTHFGNRITVEHFSPDSIYLKRDNNFWVEAQELLPTNTDESTKKINISESKPKSKGKKG